MEIPHERSPSADDPTIAAVRGEVRRLMQGFGPDYFRDLDAARAFPEAFFQAVAARGYFGSLLPVQYGGSEAGPAVASVILEEINRAGGDASAVNAQLSICGTLLRDGSDAQRAQLLPGIARGELRCLGVAATEPDSGADMRTLKSKARREGDDWVLDAHKIFISLAEHTRLILLLTQAEEGPTLFLLDRQEHGHGISLAPVEMIVNRLTTTLFIDGLRVPDRCRVGAPGAGLTCLMRGFAQRRILAAAECLGNARFLLDRSLAHARERVIFERPIGANQGVQYPLAQAYAHVEAADLMRWDALRELLSGRDAGPRSALARLLASDAASEAGRAALTTFGGWALASELHIERKLRESLVFAFNNLLWSHVAQQALGLPDAF
jgi:acyl-CoA dehydrogenase